MSYSKQDLSRPSPAPFSLRRARGPLASALVASFFVACGGGSAEGPPPDTAPPVPPEPPGKPTVQRTLAEVGLEAAALDRSVDPCTDFYSFACGGWIKNTQIPSDKARWVRSFSVIHEENEKELRRILEEAGKATDAEPVKQTLGGYYAACMDEQAIEAQGTKPLEPLLKQVRSIRDQKSLIAAVTKLHQHRIWALFDISAQQDFADATRIIAFMDQNGLGLPDRDYYVLEPAALPTHTSDPGKHPSEVKAAPPSKEALEALEKKKKLLADYEAHVARMLELGGMAGYAAKAAAKDVLKIETALAQVSKTKVERRDPKKLYNKVDREGVEKTVPRFDWKSYFTALGTPELKDISVTSREFFAGVNDLLPKFKPAQWKNYLTWQVLHAMAPTLSKAFVEEDFKLQKLLTGQEEIEARWKRCVAATDDALGEALAQPFVEEHFAGDSKTAAESYVHAIAAAFEKQVEHLDWMDPTTRQRAKAKLKAMAYLIGYPSKWKQYDFAVAKDFAANVLAAEEWKLKDDLSQLGKPVDRERWEMSPPTVNAYYHPNKNHMVFPAGILQPPFYDVKAAVAVNLGAMGMVVGHELTHGFDDEGSQFDKDGNLKNWWEPPVEKTFKGKTACVADQYSSYEVLPGVKINGKLTLGENIADMGGLKLAFGAYRSLRKDAAEHVEAEGFTEDQQFFISNGQIWCAKYREEAARMQVVNDPHSAPRFRVNGPLSNLPEFAEAFQCKAGTPMNPENRCSVW